MLTPEQWDAVDTVLAKEIERWDAEDAIRGQEVRTTLLDAREALRVAQRVEQGWSFQEWLQSGEGTTVWLTAQAAGLKSHDALERVWQAAQLALVVPLVELDFWTWTHTADGVAVMRSAAESLVEALKGAWRAGEANARAHFGRLVAVHGWRSQVAQAMLAELQEAAAVQPRPLRARRRKTGGG